MNRDKYIQQLEETIMRLIAEKDAALGRIRELEVKNKQLEAEKGELIKNLRIYENPHTSPSMQIVKKKNVSQKKDTPPKKRGAPIGHRGATRKTPIPDEVKEVVAHECEKCGSVNIEKQDECEKKVIIDKPPPQKIKVTQFNRWKVKCLDCGHSFISKDEDCPQIGDLGIYLLVYITMLKFHLRGVTRKIQDFLLYHDDFEISPMGICNSLLRVGNVCKREYEKIVEKIRNAKWNHIDETGIKVNGEKWWLWIFRTPENDVVVVIRKSRGSNVPREILGEDYKGAVIVDGWMAYNWIEIIQRCWAHLIREVDDCKDVSWDGKGLSNSIHVMYDELKEYIKGNPTMEDRTKKKDIWDKRIEKLVGEYSMFSELEKPITYIRNGLGNWYTCILYPGMESTNNLGEQAMREHVIMRKIIGCFRSENGSQNYQYIASMLATWKLQGKNPFVELEQLLRRKLCLG